MSKNTEIGTSVWAWACHLCFYNNCPVITNISDCLWCQHSCQLLERPKQRPPLPPSPRCPTSPHRRDCPGTGPKTGLPPAAQPPARAQSSRRPCAPCSSSSRQRPPRAPLLVPHRAAPGTARHGTAPASPARSPRPGADCPALPCLTRPSPPPTEPRYPPLPAPLGHQLLRPARPAQAHTHLPQGPARQPVFPSTEQTRQRMRTGTASREAFCVCARPVGAGRVMVACWSCPGAESGCSRHHCAGACPLGCGEGAHPRAGCGLPAGTGAKKGSPLPPCPFSLPATRAVSVSLRQVCCSVPSVWGTMMRNSSSASEMSHVGAVMPPERSCRAFVGCWGMRDEASVWHTAAAVTYCMT